MLQRNVLESPVCHFSNVNIVNNHRTVSKLTNGIGTTHKTFRFHQLYVHSCRDSTMQLLYVALHNHRHDIQQYSTTPHVTLL